jgi:PAS domain S-box-containing protein
MPGHPDDLSISCAGAAADGPPLSQREGAPRAHSGDRTPTFQDEELVEHLDIWADVLHRLAERWRFRAKAGRLGKHSLVETLQLADRLDGAARLLEVTLEGKETPSPVSPEASVDTALEESEERFRLLVDSVKDYAIFLLDPDGRVMSWNAGAERIKGYRAEEVIGKSFSIFYPPELLQQNHPANELRIAEREGRYHEQGWRLRKSGARFWADVTITALRDETGRLRGFAKVTGDMTERREVDESIRRLNLELAERVRERTVALEAMSAANRELEAFSYSVSHDLRAPLRGIDGFSKLLLEKYATAIDDKGRHYLERIRAASQRMSQLIDGLLTLSRITRTEPRRARIDLGIMAREMAEELQKSEPEREVAFSIVNSAPAEGDPDLLRVVLDNLLRNAWKFTSQRPKAQIEFGIVPSPPSTNEGPGDGLGQTVYFVRDNGAGFDMEYAGKLFAPFQRLHDASEFEGTGIGLATVQRILLRHGGRIWGEGIVDQGATFWFTIGEMRP